MNSKLFKIVKAKIKQGKLLREALQDSGVSYSSWYKYCHLHNIVLNLPKGKKAKVYTPERVKQAKKRIMAGEFLRNVATDMGMDPRNLARYCRINGIQLFSKKALHENYQRRKKEGRGRQRRIHRNEIEKAILRGKKDSSLAEKFGVTRQHVNYLRQKLRKEANNPDN